jgi:repressor of nif and glnA expression
MSDFETYLTEDARLVILRELDKQTDGRLNEALLAKTLDAFGHNRSREWVRTQLRKLGELGAVKLTEVGTFMVAAITRSGIDHVERRSIIEGVARPSPEA